MRTHLNKYLKDDQRNIYNINLKEISKDRIVMKLRSDDEYLQEWVESVDGGTLDKSFNHIGEYLDEVTRIYTEMPEDDTSTIGTLTPLTITPIGSARSNVMERGEDPFKEHDALLSPSEQMAIAKQKEVKEQFQMEQMERTKGSQQFSDVYKNCLEHELKNSTKKSKDVFQLFLLIYRDGYTVGKSSNPKDHGELRNLKDDEMKSFQAGYVPRLFCGENKEVDVHFLHKQFKFKERMKEQRKREKLKNMEEEEFRKKIGLTPTKKESDEVRKNYDDDDVNEEEGEEDDEEEELKPLKEKKGEKLETKSKKEIVIDLKRSSYKIDPKKKLTMVKFNFPDNSKHIQKFCYDDTIQIVKNFVTEVTGEKDCDLFSANKKITNVEYLDKTLEEMNVLNSIIIVKLVQK